jgi:hypothetical protein
MWAEYAGIIVATVAQLYAMSTPLTLAFNPLRKYPELFDGGAAYVAWDILQYAALQLLFEIATDASKYLGRAGAARLARTNLTVTTGNVTRRAVCLTCEARKGRDALGVWNSLDFTRIGPIVFFAVYLASFLGQFRSLYGDNFSKCYNVDMCNCVGQGLLPGSVRESYCTLIYPNTSGVPPSNPPLSPP